MAELLRAMFLFSGQLKRRSFAAIFFCCWFVIIGFIIVLSDQQIPEGLFIVIPFGIWIELSITVCRLRDAGTNVYFALLLFVVGLFLILYCLFAPSKVEAKIEIFEKIKPLDGAEEKLEFFENPKQSMSYNEVKTRETKRLEKNFWSFIINFSGRISRKTYLLSVIVHLASFAGIVGVLIALEVEKRDASAVIILFLFLQGLSLLSLTVRRAHDIGKTTRWVIFNVLSVVGIGIVVLMCLAMGSDSSENEYGLPADQVEKNKAVSVSPRGRFERD